ncbi:MAG TPA: VOC family protein [Acidimicrobiales bacterium]|nr:VOC family protein [Acidimicrobiales bacterium]
MKPANPHRIELGYVGLEVTDRAAFGGFLTDVVGLVPGAPTTDGDATWRNDGRAQRLVVAEGDTDDAAFVGFEAVDAAAFGATVARLEQAGYTPTAATGAEVEARRVADLVHVEAPWGVRVELVHGLAAAPDGPATLPLVAGGFLTEGLGFGHVVFATLAFDESHHFVTEGLGMVQSDWVETELAPGIDLEVRFYHCNERHHSLALARAPFELPQKLHHVMFEVNDRDDVGRAFDRAWSAGLGIANGLGRHDNDGMFSFYVVTPAGFQVEVGHGARRVTDDWDDNRRYDRISLWGHQPLSPGAP